MLPNFVQLTQTVQCMRHSNTHVQRRNLRKTRCLIQSDLAMMIIGFLLCLGFFTACRATTTTTTATTTTTTTTSTTTTKWRPPYRGAFAPVPVDNDTSQFLEGDIAPNPIGSGSTLNSFRNDSAALWSQGRVPWRIDEDEWKGIWEPVFLDEAIENITNSLRKIEAGVPCIDFEWVSPSLTNF